MQHFILLTRELYRYDFRLHAGESTANNSFITIAYSLKMQNGLHDTGEQCAFLSWISFSFILFMSYMWKECRSVHSLPGTMHFLFLLTLPTTDVLWTSWKSTGIPEADHPLMLYLEEKTQRIFWNVTALHEHNE